MTATALPASGTAPSGMRLLANETGKGLQLLVHRKGLAMNVLVVNTVTFLGIRLLIGGGHLITPLLTVTLPALLAFTVAHTAALQGSGGIAEEINAGTLAQTQLGPATPELQVVGRLAALAIEGLSAAVALAVVFTVAFGLHYQLRPALALPAVLTVLDALGYALLIIALTVRVVSIGAITHVFGMAIQFFAGTLVPITVFPDAMQTVVRVIPTALGVQAVNTTLAGHGLSAAWADGSLPWLIVHATASLVLGWALYTRNVRRARADAGL